MQRVARWCRLKPGTVDEYVRLHQNVSEVLREAHPQAGIKNFSIYLYDLELFSYLETSDWEKSLESLSHNPLAAQWMERMKTLMDDPIPWIHLEEIFHVD